MYYPFISGKISGGKITEFFLETSRLVHQEIVREAVPKDPLMWLSLCFQGERSYHVFYEFISGLDAVKKEELSLKQPEGYFYLNQVGIR